MSKKNGTAVAAVVIIAVVIIGAAIWFWKKSGPEVRQTQISVPTEDLEIYQFDKSKCPGPEMSLRVTDVYMRGVFEKDSTVPVVFNWYACHEVQRGDKVLYRYSWKREPVIREVVAIAGDRIHLVKDKARTAWNLEINGKIFLRDQKPYFFGAEATPPLGLYEASHGGILAKGNVVVLSNFPPGDSDSGIFGAVNVEDIVGVVQNRQ